MVLVVVDELQSMLCFIVKQERAFLPAIGDKPNVT